MPTILLIEDNEFIRENTAEILELAGYTVLTAENGKIGVARAIETKPDLVVCDIMMPVLDGYGVLQIFNQNPQLAGVPFIFLTAKTERADLRRGMELGADDYLTKPFDESELLSAITGRLNRFRQLRPEYDLQTPGGLGQFLDDASVVGNLMGLTADRRPHTLKKKQELYAEGDEPTRLYFVQAGRVKTMRRTAAGKELITGVYGPGEFFGYLPLLQQIPHPDSAVALEDATLLYIPQEDFLQLLHRNAAVGQQFVRLLAGRVSEREQQLLGMAYHSLRRRVADLLLQLHEQQVASHAEAPLIQLSRDDMAALIGTAPESLIRTLSEFKQDGLIEMTNHGIRLLNPQKLRQPNW
ncbi:cAMP-binding domain of CRP or a regulatory subunit of cAMP-dependent protein kinases [Hymenobacter gelipurpurascens]|uniref:cAMP-binding domain of CRP or a regulatory subunit of cAMP-dependent protein kinases n=1 Tax=Hymenobacter gelipurpurascens TaxID=89968 RepID=A0A212TPQ7_9BACT|nr:response regulator [Hymenobacter gelipurpurascens]SNC67814.1 cAMP-binding domain of CRP or a regulatory subunit of cAMP-dependent protein kinases [Hymenobacter gelipurpurascens]